MNPCTALDSAMLHRPFEETPCVAT